LIVNLKAEYPGFSTHEIATICFLRFERRPSDHTAKRILADGPKPTVTERRYPPYAQIADPYQRRRAIVVLANSDVFFVSGQAILNKSTA
jgi:hypothetical protein